MHWDIMPSVFVTVSRHRFIFQSDCFFGQPSTRAIRALCDKPYGFTYRFTSLQSLQSLIRQTIASPLYCLNVHSTWSLLTVLILELDCLTFWQCPEALFLIHCVNTINPIFEAGLRHTWIALKWAKTSLLPSSGVMKPNPLDSFHDLTVPLIAGMLI